MPSFPDPTRGGVDRGPIGMKRSRSLRENTSRHHLHIDVGCSERTKMIDLVFAIFDPERFLNLVRVSEDVPSRIEPCFRKCAKRPCWRYVLDVLHQHSLWFCFMFFRYDVISTIDVSRTFPFLLKIRTFDSIVDGFVSRLGKPFLNHHEDSIDLFVWRGTDQVNRTGAVKV